MKNKRKNYPTFDRDMHGQTDGELLKLWSFY